MNNEVANSATALTSNAFTPPAGYSFSGWNTVQNGVGGTAYTNGQVYDFSADLTLYAQWAVIPPSSHTVTFNGNGSDGGSTASETANTSTALTSNGFTRTGYTFAGWNTVQNGVGGTAYADGASYDFSADLTLYAQWTANTPTTYTLTYIAGSNGSVTGTLSQTVNSGGSGTTVTAVANSGYHFTQWSDGVISASRTDTNVQSNNSYTAMFVADSHTVVFNANGGSGTMSNEVENAATALTLNAFAYTHFNFNGWNTAQNGSGTAYTDGQSYGFTADLTLYAQWTPITYTVTFNADGGTGTMSSQSSTTAANLTPNTFTRSGYTFAGWDTLPSGVGTMYADGASYPFTSDATLYATWTQITYTITSSENGGSAGDSISPTGTLTVVSGGSQAFTVTTNGSDVADVLVDGVDQGSISSYTFNNVTANHTISVSFAAAGGSGSGFVFTYIAGPGGTISGSTVQNVDQAGDTATDVTAVPNPGYHFVGWDDGATDATRNDTEWNEANTTWFDQDITTTAEFAINTYTITSSTGTNGSITPLGTSTDNYGSNQTFTITPASGYHVSNVVVDGSSVGTPTTYQFTSIAANHTISATFAANAVTPPSQPIFNSPNPTTFTLTYSAGLGGSVSGPNQQTVNSGDSGKAVTAVASTGYHFVQWSDGKTTPSRTDANVTANESFRAIFAQDPPVVITHTIMVSGGVGGTVSPSGSTIVNDGASLTISFTPSPNYHVASVVIDGVNIGGVYQGSSSAVGAVNNGGPNSYTFTNITADHSASVTFAANSTTPTGPGSGPAPTSGPIVPEGSDGVKATESGVNDPVVLSIIQGGTGVKLSANNWSIQIASDKKEVYGVQLPSKIQVYLIRGVNATTSGYGFLPGSIARVYLFSTGVFLGQAVVQSDGSFSAHFPVSAQTTLGHHVMQVEGTAYDGQPRTAAVGLQVIDRPANGLVNLGTIFYGLNISNLTPTNVAKVAAAMETAEADGFSKIWIYGFTDRQTGVNNEVLSKLRSSKIADLINSILPTSIVGFKYFGPANPKDKANTQAAYAKNRRSEIWGQP